MENYTPTRFMAETSHYDKGKADYAVNFIELLSHTKGTWAGKKFELLPWQEQIIRDVFGVVKENGYRQFNTAYIEIGKKNGKSELAAAVALYLLCADGEQRAEIYGCASDRQQASIVFEVAADMVRMCPALAKRCKIMSSTKRIVYLPTNSFYQVLSSEAYSKHGFNVHGVVMDELHSMPDRKLYDVMTKGSGDARMQPLFFLITTAGTDTNSICYEVHSKAKDILEGRKHDETFYPVIYGADPDDDWTDPKVWMKANPSLGITIGLDKVQAACDSARQNPGEENAFRQLRLDQWVKQVVRWMNDGSSFYNCTALKELRLPKNTSSLEGAQIFMCSALELLDLGVASEIGANISSSSSWAKLTTLILRNAEQVVTPYSTTVFYASSPLGKGEGKILVPRSMVASYKADSTWGAYAAEIYAIEDYPELAE